MTRAVITAESLFATYFWPHYPADVRADYERLREVDANPGKNPRLSATLGEAASIFVDNARDLFGVTLTLDDAGVYALAKAMSRERRDAWLAESEDAGPDSVFFNAVLHASAFVGEVIVRSHGGAWELRRPMWESVVRRKTRGAIAPFHWLLKSLADDAIDEMSLAARWRVHVVMASAEPGELPVVTTAKRLPTLKTPTYDLLVKYLHQHLPELRDVGEGFPSPGEFTARGYASVGVEVLHGGRVLAMHGQVPGEGESADTVEVTWLTARGFDHADTVPCDKGVPHFARAANEETLELTVAWNGRPITHRLGLRGHL